MNRKSHYLFCLLLSVLLLLSGCSAFSNEKTVLLDVSDSDESGGVSGEMKYQLKKTYVLEEDDNLLDYAWCGDDSDDLLLLRKNNDTMLELRKTNYRNGFYDTLFTRSLDRIVMATLSPSGRYLVYAELPEDPLDNFLYFTRRDLEDGSQTSFALYSACIADLRNEKGSLMEAAVHYGLSCQWSRTGDHLAVRFVSDYRYEYTVTVVVYDAQADRSWVFRSPDFLEVMDIDPAGERILVLRYNMEKLVTASIINREGASYFVISQPYDFWIGFDGEDGLLFTQDKFLLHCNLGDTTPYETDDPASWPNSFDIGEYGLSDSIVLSYMLMGSRQNVDILAVENERYLAFVQENVSGISDVYVSRLDGDQLTNSQPVYKAPYGEYAIRLSHDASRLVIRRIVMRGLEDDGITDPLKKEEYGEQAAVDTDLIILELE